MAPLPIPMTNTTIPNFDPYTAPTHTSSSFQFLLEQWKNPSDILAILMLIGGDIIRQSLGSLSGSRIVPVSFSFGWVAYSFSALISVFGSGTLMPVADYKAKVINVQNSYCKDNENWVIGRLLRDYRYGKDWVKITTTTTGFKAPLIIPMAVGSPTAVDTARKAKQVKSMDFEKGLPKTKEEKNLEKSCQRHPFHVSVFEVDKNKKAADQDRDRVWWTGIIVAIIQIGISVIPGALESDWVIFFVTVFGTILAFLGGSLPQWGHEKWSCRRLKENDKQTIAITGGNGSRHVIVIKSEEGALNLEDLATGPSYCDSRKSTSYFMVIFVVLWLALLLTVAGINQNTWYLMVIGFIGMIQNVFAASAVRKPSAYGIHLKPAEGDGMHHFCEPKVMDTLKKVDKLHSGVGWSLVSTFFPGGLRPEETEYWDKETEKREKAKAEAKKRDEEEQAALQSSDSESDNRLSEPTNSPMSDDDAMLPQIENSYSRTEGYLTTPLKPFKAKYKFI